MLQPEKGIVEGVGRLAGALQTFTKAPKIEDPRRNLALLVPRIINCSQPTAATAINSMAYNPDPKDFRIYHLDCIFHLRRDFVKNRGKTNT